MCDICKEVLELIGAHDERMQKGKEGLYLSKTEVLTVVYYTCNWQQRQCMCCYKDYKNFERFSNIVQVILNVGIELINSLASEWQDRVNAANQLVTATREVQESVVQPKKPTDVTEDAGKEKSTEGTQEQQQQAAEESKGADKCLPPEDAGATLERQSEKENEETAKGSEQMDVNPEKTDTEMKPVEPVVWTLEEKDHVFQFIGKVFLVNFPLYAAYKEIMHASLEELSPQEASALSNYCELTDPEIPVYLLRNVCFFCDSNGIGAIAQCFYQANPDVLPCIVANTLISIIANLRLWMNIPTVMQYIIPLRSSVIRYMCRLSDKDLRMAGTRNMTDLMWTAMKEPIETQVTFDKEGMDLAFKYFTCSTLTIRLTGIAQINNQINLYNELANGDSLLEAESIGKQLAKWLSEHKILGHIFGPNLHVELIKQSQMILNFLAVEGRITNEHIDIIWAAGQLKHCGKQVHDILIPLIKNIEIGPAQHLLTLVSQLDPTAHTEQTLYLASALIKYVWNMASAHNQGTPMQRTVGRVAYSQLARQQRRMRQGACSPEGVSPEGGQHVCTEYPGIGYHIEQLVPGTMQHRHRHMHPELSEGEESGNTSLVANSDLSNISEDSLQEDMSEHECGHEECEHDVEDPRHQWVHGCTAHEHHAHRLQVKGRHKRHDTDSSLEEEEVVVGAKGRWMKRRPHREHHLLRDGEDGDDEEEEEDEDEEEDDDDDEEEDDEEEDLDEEELCESDEEVAKHMKIVHVHRRKGHPCEHEEVDEEEEEEEDSSEYSSEDFDMPVEETEAVHKPASPKDKPARQQPASPRKGPKSPKAKKPGSKGKGPASPKGKAVRQDQALGQVSIGHVERHWCEKCEQGGHSTMEEMSEINTSREEGELYNTSSEVERARVRLNLSGENIDISEEAAILCHLQESSDGDRSFSQLTKGVEPEELHHCLERLHAQAKVQAGGVIPTELIEDILSPEDGSCNSSRISAKSDKNHGDFEGEDMLSEEELAHINAHAQGQYHADHHMHQQLASMASLYQERGPRAVVHHRPKPVVQQAIAHKISLANITEPGGTLVWDLIQDDKACQLTEGLVLEAEKVLCNLVCFTTDRRIRTRFIEACVENVVNHRSVVISLRLLPKLFNSFQQYRNGLDTHSVTMWAARELRMLKHFFNDLIFYTKAVKSGVRFQNSLYTYREQIQVRLHFLTNIFSSASTDENFRLTLEQVDTLWNCLATDPECSDDCFNWFHHQARSKDLHAMGMETFKHIFLEKMPKLKPEDMSMVGLNLFTQLCTLARVADTTSLDKPSTDDKAYGMDQMWGIALRAQNTDVSLTAIHYLNTHYINSLHKDATEREEEFVQRCMDSLVNASSQLQHSPETYLLVIRRGLILLTTHLESFRKRYAYHLRNWQLDGSGITSHQKSLQDKSSAPLRVVLQPAGSSEKTTVEMLSTDLVAELRAEITRWWETVQRELQQQQQLHQLQQQQRGQQGSVLTPILGAMLGDGPIRLITGGQELCPDMDEKTLGDLQFKDMQVVYVSLGANRGARKQEGMLTSSTLPPPSRDQLPMMLLLAEPHFGRLFRLLQQLSTFKPGEHPVDQQERHSLEMKARVLSKKVWDLLMLLPSNPGMLSMFQQLNTQGEESGVCWEQLLDPQNPHKLMYSLQIVESLSLAPRHRRKSVLQSRSESIRQSTESEMSVDEQEMPEEVWSKRFICHGGLKHLFQVFMSGSLQIRDAYRWNEWQQDCLAYLLRLLSQFAVQQADTEEDPFETQESPRKKMKKAKNGDKVLIPRLNQTIVSMIEVDSVVQILMTIMYDAALPSQDGNHWPAASWGRVEVIHYALLFLVSFAHSCVEVQTALRTNKHFTPWLKRLTLEAPEPAVRQEAGQGVYRLCLGKTAEGKSGYCYLLPTLASMLSFLEEAQSMKPAERSQEDKEPYGPGCRDYFWLVCGLLDGISKTDSVDSWEKEDSLINLDALARKVTSYINSRPYLESNHRTREDDGLIGLISLCTSILKHSPPFKESAEGRDFLGQMYWNLFALPSPEHRHLPKCKSQLARHSTYDLLVEMIKGSVYNYSILHELVLKQHHKDTHAAYSWDAWPHEEERSRCGYVGLTNLGATCYMATCMQHLYMIPEARKSVLEASCAQEDKHDGTLQELKKMFAYLLESERKAYNPRSFCKVYTMDHQPLNTGEQKDMTEFFTDLITKLEEMGPELKTLVKSLFGGVLTNNVVSLDCHHVSRTKEEFYTVRCQVADMKNLYESLDEVTVKDMLEGDNMYTCSKCQKKVRAEKRACFKKLPNILCFNTMRYTFNMVTMMKEKVNTHFSFPLRLDMSPYMEKHLIGKERIQADEDEKQKEEQEGREEEEGYDYELIGVTVHTGTADGGHYYSFIRDKLSKTQMGQDKWYLFNDAEVKPFDICQIAAECFGGEMTSKTYDSVTDKFMDFSFEKTNSAYMLFYERIPLDPVATAAETEKAGNSEEQDVEHVSWKADLSKELAEWIWQDNMQFLQDKNLFEHTYFTFMWQLCFYIPSTLPRDHPQYNIPLMVAKLSVSFVLETLIHAKEKPTMYHWIELLTKQFNSCHEACEWFLDTMAEDDWWPQQILIRCPNQVVRQMFQRLVIHVINQLKPTHSRWYLHPIHPAVEGEEDADLSEMGAKSCVTRFIRKMLAILDNGPKLHCKFLNEYFAFLLDFAKMGDNESYFLIQIQAISTMANFLMSHKVQTNYVEIVSDDEEEEEEDVISLTPDDKYRPQSLEKMITLIAKLTERSRGADKGLHLSDKDYQSLLGGKAFPFLYHQIRDNINLQHTCNLIFSLSRWNERMAVAVIQMIFHSISRLGTESQPFFKLLSMLVEMMGGPPGMPPFTHFILQKVWEVIEYCPHQCLEWLGVQVVRNKLARSWCLQKMELWVEPHLVAHNNIRVRNAAAHLLAALVPSEHFRQTFRHNRNILSPHKDNMPMSTEALGVLHEVYNQLLKLLPRVRQYADANTHGTAKLVPYFLLMGFCLISRTEKLMFSRYFMDLWHLFQPKLSEPAISMFHNKQALLMFWHKACVDCPDNVRLIVTTPIVTKYIALNYILADHEDQEVALFNRSMLPAYYGILRMCCQESRSFTRQLAHHQNTQWAFQYITPYPAQYTAAVEELFKIMQLMVKRYPDTTEEEWKAISFFRRSTIQLYLQHVEPRHSWQSLISALKILVETQEDYLLVLQLQGLPVLHEAFNTLHLMHHEATACHVAGDIVDLLSLVLGVLKTARQYIADKKGAEVKPQLANWKELVDFSRKLLTLLNSYTPNEIRQISLDVLREMVLTYQVECLSTIVPFLLHAHTTFQDNNVPVPVGPYFPKRGQRVVPHKSSIRPPRPQFQMFLHSNQLEASKGVDEVYDQALSDFFTPYHTFVDLLVRMTCNQQNISDHVVALSASVAYEGVPLHLPYFAKLWYEIYQSEHVDKKVIAMLCLNSSFIDYVDAVLLDERQSLNNHHIYQFFCNFFPKVYQQVLSDQGQNLMENILDSIAANKSSLEEVNSDLDLHKLMNRINGDLKALMLIFSVQQPKLVNAILLENLHFIHDTAHSIQHKRTPPMPAVVEQHGLASDNESDESPPKRRKTSTSDNEAASACPKLPTPVPDKVPPAASPEKDSEMPTTSKQTESSSPQKEQEQGQGDIKVKEVKVTKESPDSSTSVEKEKKPEDIQEDGDGVKSKTSTPQTVSAPETTTVAEGAQNDVLPPGDKPDKEADKVEVRVEGQGPRSTAHKDRPSIVDQVVRNTEKVFTMLKK